MDPRIVTPNQCWPALNMSRVFGDLHAHEQGATWLPEVRLLDAQIGDVLVLATDGVWDVFENEEELMGFLFAEDGKKLNRERASEAIVTEAKKRWNEKLDDGFHDDITCVVMGL